MSPWCAVVVLVKIDPREAVLADEEREQGEEGVPHQRSWKERVQPYRSRAYLTP